jgi:hypothetical protein
VTLVFPQLSSGAMAHLPLSSIRRRRTVLNSLMDGTRVVWRDSGAERLAWTLRYTGLSDDDAEMLADFFDSTAGRLNSFLFVDPAANLLAFSSDLSQSCWNKDPMLQVGTGSASPIGAGASIRIVNGGQSAQRISQRLNAPAWFQYAFSAYARADAAATIRLVRSTEGAAVATVQTLGPVWERVQSAGSLGSGATAIDFAVELDPGASIEICGLQVEAQPNPSAYKRSASTNGVYTARFDQDAIEVICEGPDDNALSLRIVTAPGE